MMSTGAGVLRACSGLQSAGVYRLARQGRAPYADVLRLLPTAFSHSSMTPSRSGVESDDGGSLAPRHAGVGGGGMSGHPLPVRTVPDEILGFSCRTYLAADSNDRYPNAHGIHPAEFKVELMVPVPLLELSEKEEERLIQLVGPRYRAKDQVLRLVSDRFPNRIDNKRYLVHLLENILVEARNIDDDDDD